LTPDVAPASILTVVVAYAIVLGLVIGSFLNVVAYRVPAGRSLVRPGSACPSCGTAIRPVDNLPVLSWLLLRGRCRACRSRISLRYPLVEAGTAVLFAATVLVVGVGWTLPAHLWFVSVTFVLAIIDFDTKRLPNRVLYPGTVVGVVLLGVGSWADGSFDAFLRGLLGGAAYFAGLLLIALIARGGFGFGDVKLAFLLGLFTAHVSWAVLVVGVFAAFAVGGVAAVILLATGRAGRKDAVPFGPSMVAGAWLAIVAGEPIARWYLG
jgi:leader peptidase (prepilin peptidase) / N-methyltransferase